MAAKKKPAAKPKAKPKPKPAAPTAPADRYEEHRRKMGERQSAESRAGRDIGEIPPVENPKRRAGCARSLKRHCEIYHPEDFFLRWSKNHLLALDRSQRAAVRGELFAVAMARGDGKTTLAKATVEWAVLNGHSRFVALIGFDIEDAVEMLGNIREWLEESPLLLADYPEVCYPIRRLEGIPQRKLLYHGKRISLEWHSREIVLPRIPDSVASGSCIRACGLLSRLRGMNHRGLRPDLFVANDIQSDQSAVSPDQVRKRLSVLQRAVLGLAGPGRTIGGILTCTVLAPGDVADQVVDRKRHPEWRGLRTAMLESFPDDLGEWERYYQVYRACMADEAEDFTPANRYYRANRKALDLGGVASWPARKGPDVSALQHAMNLRCIVGHPAFLAEYQNAPEDERKVLDLLTVDGLASRLNQMDRRVLAPKVAHVTAHVDVHDQILYWTAAGWEPDFTGQVADYGTWPEQGLRYFIQRDPPRKLREAYPGAGKEGAVLAGLTALVDSLAKLEFRREDGAVLRIGRLLIDGRYDRDLVTAFCRRSPHAALLLPAMGYGLPKGREWSGFFLGKEGGQTGFHWRIPPAKDGGRYVLVDTNFWKTLAWERLRVARGDPGCWSLFGREPGNHALLFDHYTSEKPVWTVARDLGRYEWELTPGRDNHLWDNLVGCAVAASMLGVAIPGIVVRRSGWAAAAGGAQTLAQMREAARR